MEEKPGGGVVFMVGANSAMAWVVQNNYRAGTLTTLKFQCEIYIRPNCKLLL